VQLSDYYHTYGASGLNIFTPLGATTTAIQTLNWNWDPTRLSLQPLFVGPEGLTVSQLTFLVTGFAGYVSGGVARLGIYDTAPVEDHDVYPRGLVKDFGVTAVPTGTGFVSTTDGGPSAVLTNGLYWLASVRSIVAAGTYSVMSRGTVQNGMGPNPLGGIDFNLTFASDKLAFGLADMVSSYNVADPLPAYIGLNQVTKKPDVSGFYFPCLGFT
jgi:hypothetical protein